MKNFKIFFVETLIQFTILLSITRNQNDNRFEDLLAKSLADFHKHNFLGIDDKNTHHKHFNLESSFNKNYLNSIVKHNHNRQYQLYLNPLNYLRVTDKFLEYPELQTKNSLVRFCNNANISLEVSFFFF